METDQNSNEGKEYKKVDTKYDIEDEHSQLLTGIENGKDIDYLKIHD